MFSTSALEIGVPSMASPVAGSSLSVTEFPTKRTFEGLVERKSTITRDAVLSGTGSTRTLRILPSRRRRDPSEAVKNVNSNAPTTPTPANRKIRNRLSTLIAEQSSVRFQAGDMIAQSFQRGRHGDGQK